MRDVQRTKTSKWSDDNDVESVVDSLVTVFNWLEVMYLRHFTKLADFDKDYRAPSMNSIREAVRELESTFK